MFFFTILSKKNYFDIFVMGRFALRLLNFFGFFDDEIFYKMYMLNKSWIWRQISPWQKYRFFFFLLKIVKKTFKNDFKQNKKIFFVRIFFFFNLDFFCVKWIFLIPLWDIKLILLIGVLRITTKLWKKFDSKNPKVKFWKKKSTFSLI